MKKGLAAKFKDVWRNRLAPKKRLKKKSNKKVKKKLVNKAEGTLKIYRDRLGFNKPSPVFLDGSFLFYAIHNKIPIGSIRELLGDPETKLYTSHCALKELESYVLKFTEYGNMGQFNEVTSTLRMAPCQHKHKMCSSDCIMSFVKRDNMEKLFVATHDNAFLQKICENPLIPAVVGDKGRFALKCLSKNDQKLLCLKYPDPVIKPTIINKEYPDGKRLKDRLNFFEFAHIPVEGDGNCLVRALSEQVTHSDNNYGRVREVLVEQLRSNEDLYSEKVKEFMESRPKYFEKYLENVNRNSKGNEGGDLVSIKGVTDLTYADFLNHYSQDMVTSPPVIEQVAADRFEAKIVCICSQENFAIEEFIPHGHVDSGKVLYLALVNGVETGHADSIYPKSTPSASCSHLFDLGVTEERT